MATSDVPMPIWENPDVPRLNTVWRSQACPMSPLPMPTSDRTWRSMASIRRMHSIDAGRPHEALSVLQLAYETLRELIDDPGRGDRLRGVLLRMARLGEDNGMRPSRWTR